MSDELKLYTGDTDPEHDVVASEWHKQRMQRTPDPSLTRILKLAAYAYAYGKAAMGRSMQDANDEETALMDIENIYDNLTPEDIARIKEISL